jgi:alpha-D-ribose 1-methylphosphonate 5-triphosphate diphosphatase
MPADVVIEHDYIIDVDPYKTYETYGTYGTVGKIHDFGDRLLVPGFVDLHSDAIEKEIEPRPGASFPVPHALVDLDKKLAMSGITTMFHAVAFNDESLVGQRGTAVAAQTISEIVQCNRQTLLVDNLVHARYEITSFNSIPVIKKLLHEGSIRLLSLMDHSPGQGQFRSLESWKKYHIPVYNMAERDVDTFVKDKIEKRTISLQYLEELTACARELGITLASHDDDTTGKVDLMHELGIRISEFPLNVETAAYAQKRNMATGMGAPNVVRGKSQNGNISARSLVEQGLCNFLCSDYHPCSMLQAVYAMYREMGIELAQAYAYVSTTPAQIGGLFDRGKIEPGLLADILVVEDSNLPKIVMTLKDGTSIYNSTNCLCSHESV